MKNGHFYKLKGEFAVYDPIESKLSKWDKGEHFIYRKAEKKRHGKGEYPNRLISLTDGSMVAIVAVRQLEKQHNTQLLEEVDIIS